MGQIIQSARSGISSEREEDRIIQKRTDVARLSYHPKRGEPDQGQDGSRNKAESPHEYKGAENNCGVDPPLIEVLEQPFQEDQWNEKTTKAGRQVGLEAGYRQRF